MKNTVCLLILMASSIVFGSERCTKYLPGKQRLALSLDRSYQVARQTYHSPRKANYIEMAKLNALLNQLPNLKNIDGRLRKTMVANSDVDAIEMSKAEALTPDRKEDPGYFFYQINNHLRSRYLTRSMTDASDLAKVAFHKNKTAYQAIQIFINLTRMVSAKHPSDHARLAMIVMLSGKSEKEVADIYIYMTQHLKFYSLRDFVEMTEAAVASKTTDLALVVKEFNDTRSEMGDNKYPDMDYPRMAKLVRYTSLSAQEVIKEFNSDRRQVRDVYNVYDYGMLTMFRLLDRYAPGYLMIEIWNRTAP